MTAVTKINYIKSRVDTTNTNSSTLALLCKAIGASEYSLPAFLGRLNKLRLTKVPTLVEISGFEGEYESHKTQIDMFFKFLSSFSKKHRLVKFAVKIGSMKYVL